MVRNGSADYAAKQGFLGAVLLIRPCRHDGVISRHVSGAQRARGRSAPGSGNGFLRSRLQARQVNISACEFVCAKARCSRAEVVLLFEMP
jgi:hypothetical protein